MKGNKVTSATSGDNGIVTIYSLAYGEYFLLETKAPAGYNLLDEAVNLPIDGTTHTAEKTVTDKNASGAILPSTGGIGTTIYTVSGIVMLCACCLIILTNTNH